MAITRRSLNTSLKDARIFDDDSWDAVTAGFIKEEPHDEAPSSSDEAPAPMQLRSASSFKQEPQFDEDSNFSISRHAFENIHIKQEDLVEQLTPSKTEDGELCSGGGHFAMVSASQRRAVKTNLFKPRKSPYKLPSGRGNTFEKLNTLLDFDRGNATGSGGDANKNNIGGSSDNRTTNNNNKSPMKRQKKTEMEMDPEVLGRRQKQIDFGKNTRGYDNYRNIVPKTSRAEDDPQTPNKYVKYSRRGWDGLIRQWRLRLHKYDPEDK